MGWNEVQPRENAALFRDVPERSDFYFVHAYHFVCANDADAQAACTYGQEFCCSVRSAKVMGVQFHPEKSQKFGRAVLENFMRVAEES
jgi:glutamine amidotransferase